MSLDSRQSPAAEVDVLYGRLESVKPLIDALSCIYSSSHKAQDVILSLHSQGGLRFAVEEAGSLNASVILPSRTFSDFLAHDQSTRLRLNLSLLLDCLNVFGGATNERLGASVKLSYAGDGHPLVVRLQEQDADTICELTTMTCDGVEETDFQFHAHAIDNIAIVSSETLRDAIAELDYGGATTADLRLAPVKPRFRLQSPARALGLEMDGGGSARDGELDGEGEALFSVELPDPGDRTVDAFQSFQSLRTQCSVYRLAHLQRCVKALAMSESCKVQMNGQGMLSLMCRMKDGDAGVDGARERRGSGGGMGMDRCFVEFLIVALEIEEDDEDRDEDED